MIDEDVLELLLDYITIMAAIEMFEIEREYELHNWKKEGITSNSQVYSLPSKAIWQVAAVSIKQAVYLAANDIWREERKGTGIVGYTPNGAETKWRREDDTYDWGKKYKHYQQVPKEER